LVSGLCSR